MTTNNIYGNDVYGIRQTISLNKEIVGYGISFPSFFDTSLGSTTVNTGIQRINQSLYLILSTRKGERVMLPDFGIDLHKYLFEVINSQFTEHLKLAVKEVITKWEKRIIINNLDILEYPRMPNTIGIKIDYTINKTKVDGNYVFPYTIQKL